MRLLSPEHLAAIAVMVLGAVLAARVHAGDVPRRAGRARGSRRAPTARALARGLAVLIATGFVVEQTTYLVRGDWSARVNLPLQLSDAVTFVAVAALWRPRAGTLAELTWLWGLSAALMAVLTPDLGHAFPDVLYFTFFATHAGAVVAAWLLVAGMRLVPRRGAALRALGWTAAFAVPAALATLATGGNYMFLRRKPASGSILDAFGPWPVYILGAALLAAALLLFLEAVARRLWSPSAAAPTGRR